MTMEIDPKSPKTLVGAAIVLAGAVTGGSMLGYTVEPEETTQLRIDNALLEERSQHLEAQVSDLDSRVELLEGLTDQCRAAISDSRRLIEEVP